MNIFGKIFDALKAGAIEMGESVVDDNAIQTFEQAIAEAKRALEQAKAEKAKIQALQAQTKQQVLTISQKIVECEALASQAIAQDDESQALAQATQVVELSAKKSSTEQLLNIQNQDIEQLRRNISKAEQDVAEMQNQLSQVKATESVHRAQESLHAVTNQSSQYSAISSAKQSLEKIKQQQAEVQAKQDIRQQDSFSELDDRLRAAGIIGEAEQPTDAAQVLQRLKQHRSTNQQKEP